MTAAPTKLEEELRATEPCPYCAGLGGFDRGPINMFSDDDEPEYETVKCEHCAGSGKIPIRECWSCGETDAFVERADTASAYVFCNNCSARGPVCDQVDDIEETPGGVNAIAAWNTRASDAELASLHTRAETAEAERRQLRADKSVILAAMVFASECDDADAFITCWLDGSADVDEEWADWQDVLKTLVLDGKAADQPFARTLTKEPNNVG